MFISIRQEYLKHYEWVAIISIQLEYLKLFKWLEIINMW